MVKCWNWCLRDLEFMIVDVAVFVSVKQFKCFFYFVALFVCDFLANGGVVAGGVEL